ncbi:MAG: hypothetical protein R3C01_12685 [Planctomycetaceae bacterium]
MIDLGVQLRHAAPAQREVAGVLLPGDDAAAWLRWLDVAGVAPETLRLLPLSESLLPHRIAGAICPLPAEVAARVDRSCPRYGCIAGRLFVPIEATFAPPLSDVEWDEHLPAAGSCSVWHPRLGLIHYDVEQQLRVADLCRSPQQRAADWSWAEPGNAINQRLYSLQAVAPPSADDVIAGGQEDIGTQSKQLGDLPRSPTEESRANWKVIGAYLILPFPFLARWLGSMIPEHEYGSEFMSKVSDWLRNVGLNLPRLQAQRERKIHRLLDQLRNNPDEGLKYALPMSDVQGRGVAPPSSQLTSREVDFRLGSSGGGPVDHWELELQLQQQLMAQYRLAAEREIRLGRFRRAAYIHAQLLGNYFAAASALEQGHFYHEAAAVYRDKLRRPADAAHCLERGGLLEDAIEIYSELKQHVKVGELYERLEREEEAREAFQRAVAERITNDDRLGAADLLLHRLHDTEAAFYVLEAGWPNSSQSQRCLQRYFELTSTQGDRQRAIVKINQFQEDPPQQKHRTDLITTLSQVATSHSDRMVMDRAADVTRVLASQHLRQTATDTRSVLRSLANLAPQDILLERDCRRFQVKQRPVPFRPQVAVAPKQIKGGLVGRIPLPAGFTWHQAMSVDNHYYLVGHDGDETLILLRGCWKRDEHSQVSVKWVCKKGQVPDKSVLLAIDDYLPQTIRIKLVFAAPIPERQLPQTDDFPRVLSAKTPAWMDQTIIGATASGSSTYACSVQHGDLCLTLNNAHGVPLSTRKITLPSDFEFDRTNEFASLPPVPYPMFTQGKNIYIGIGRTLIRFDTNGSQQTLHLPGSITGISGSRPHSRERLLVTHAQGAYLLFPTVTSFGETMIEEDSPHLQGTILHDGRAVVWRPTSDSRGELRLYSTTNSQAVLIGTTPCLTPVSQTDHRVASPFKLLPTSTPSQVAIIPSHPNSPIALWSFPQA